jgi:hypothetical protein
MNLRSLALVVLTALGLSACQPLAQLGERAKDTDKADRASVRLAATAVLTGTAELAPAGHAGMATVSEAVTRTAGVTTTASVTDTIDAGEAALSGLAAPKPADPLTALEQERATAMALGSPELESLTTGALDRDAMASASASELRLLSDRPSYRVLYTERTPDKIGTVRAADVAVYRYDTDQAAVSTVNLADGQVAAQSLPPGYMPPLVAEEIDEAALVAKQDRAVRDALAAAGLDLATVGANALLTRGLDPDSPCATHRCLKLFFSSAEQPVPTFEVVVDLSALAVVEVLPFPTINGSDEP